MATQTKGSETELATTGSQPDPAQAVQLQGAGQVPAQPVDNGALKQLSQEESFALSRRLYRTRSDSPSSQSITLPRTRPVSQRGQAKPVPVSF